MMGENLCVDIKDAYKVYRSRKSNYHAVNGLSLSLPHGTIYGLLGPSGCGKTTLLKCIMGRIQIDAGSISVFGNSPGFAGSKSLIGYMPQENALVDKLTVMEILRLYGNIYGMESETIETRSKFLVDLLKIPCKNKRLICQFSGGQQRRTSFAVALLHNPELLILDEPTVGVEPILRHNIWNHLASLAKSNNTTIILTTHYIEEARMADSVGLMLNGQLLADAPPGALIAKHQCQTLEQVFLKLCLNTYVSNVDFSKKDSEIILKENSPLIPKIKSESIPEVKPVRRKPPCLGHVQRVKALLMKNILLFVRNPFTIVTQMFLPAFVMFLYTFAIGKPLFNLSIAVVNQDIEFGGSFLDSINNNTLIQVPYDNFERAKQGIIDGAVVAAIYIGPNFTDSLTKRYHEWIFTDEESINNSLISISVDDSNNFISFTVYKELHDAFLKFFSDMLTNKWGLNPSLAKMPIVYAEKQVYGSQLSTIDQFLIPAFLVGATYLLAVGLTAIASFSDKSSGNYERAVLAGVTFIDVTLSNILVQLLLMPVQIFLMLLTAVWLCGINCEGSYLLVVVLILLQGMCGCCFGELVSYAGLPVIGIALILTQFLISMITDGFFFSIETLPPYMQWTSEFGILKYPTESVRDVMNRGWGVTFAPVALGFVTPIAWSSIFLLGSCVLFRMIK